MNQPKFRWTDISLICSNKPLQQCVRLRGLGCVVCVCWPCWPIFWGSPGSSLYDSVSRVRVRPVPLSHRRSIEIFVLLWRPLGSDILLGSAAMSPFPRRSARLSGLAAEFDGAEHNLDNDHEVPDVVPLVDLTPSDDTLCSICGLADDILRHFPCCSAPVHRECQIFCQRCDMGDESEECVVCRCDMVAHDRFTLPCCAHDLHLDCVVRSFQACGARCPLCQTSLRPLLSTYFSCWKCQDLLPVDPMVVDVASPLRQFFPLCTVPSQVAPLL